jgi:hypothetical protein
MDAIQELLDREAIKETKARYFRLMDSKRWQEMRKVFADDARVESSKVWESADSFITDLSATLANVRSVHHGHMPEITFTGPGTARVIWAMFDYLEWEPGSRAGLAEGQRGIHGFGHYEEEYRKIDGEWKISFLRLTRLRVDELHDAPPAGEVLRVHSPDWLAGSPSLA